MIKLDGSTPIRYGLRLNMDEKYTGLKKQLSELCSLKPEQILLAEVYGSNIKVRNAPSAQQHVQTLQRPACLITPLYFYLLLEFPTGQSEGAPLCQWIPVCL